MSLWGNQDNLTGPSPVVVVGTASSEFWTASAAGLGTIATGTTVLLNLVGSEPGDDGFVTLEAPLALTGLGTDTFRVGKMSAVAAGSFEATYSTQPISLKNDPGYAPASPTGQLDRSQVAAGVDVAGVEAANAAGVGGIHAGWVGITTYVDMHGTLRTKSETFVAGAGIQTGNRPYPTT